MDLWLDLLLGSWIGLLSLFTIFFVIGMAGFLIGMFLNRIDAGE